jgi:hypothetical protein
MSGTPHPPAVGEVVQLRARIAELEAVNARLREALEAREELAAAELAVRDAQIAALAAQVGELQRRLGKDSLHVVQAAVVGRAVPQAAGPVTAHEDWPAAGQAARRAVLNAQAVTEPRRDH